MRSVKAAPISSATSAKLNWRSSPLPRVTTTSGSAASKDGITESISPGEAGFLIEGGGDQALERKIFGE